MKKLLIIMNPFAGTKQAGKNLAEMIDVFCKEGYGVEVHMTQSEGDGKKTALERASDFDIVCAIGGDGTLNEVISGIMDSGSKAKIGYIPAGTTNDFASSIGLPTNIMKAAKNVVEGEPSDVDIGSFNGRYFSYVASFGAFTNSSYEAPQDLKNAMGHAAYILSGLKDVVNIKPVSLKLTSGDETFEGDYVFGAVCNSTSMGGIINLKETDVDMNDGLFEVMLIKAPQNIIELNQIIFAITTQSYSECDQIVFFSASEVEIEPKGDMPWTLDGEYQKGEKKIRITNLKSAVKVIVPKEKEKPSPDHSNAFFK